MGWTCRFRTQHMRWSSSSPHRRCQNRTESISSREQALNRSMHSPCRCPERTLGTASIDSRRRPHVQSGKLGNRPGLSLAHRRIPGRILDTSSRPRNSRRARTARPRNRCTPWSRRNLGPPCLARIAACIAHQSQCMASTDRCRGRCFQFRRTSCTRSM